MPLAEILLIEVGPAIAKSILKAWLKDSVIGQDVSFSLIDLLKSWTTDASAQRKGKRQFEEVGDKVAENLLPLFEIEGVHLDEGGRTAVALAVAETLNKSKLSSGLLAELNLDPTKLAKHIEKAHPTATQLFSKVEQDLYQRIIKESCIYIVNIASRLPAFSERTFAEVLKREDLLLNKSNQVLEELDKIRERLDPMAEAGRFEIAYREAVARNLDVLQLLGVDASSGNRRHRLSVAYITLSVAYSSSHLSEKEFYSQDEAVETSTKPQDEIEKDRVSVNAALALSRRLLIRGMAGSGKTTLLQWIAVRSATKSFNDKLSDWNDTIPFFIRLREHLLQGLPRPEAFPGLVTSAIADIMPKGWVHTQLESGRAIVLIDGLDEVPTPQREHVRTWLSDMVGNYPQARFIISSRPDAIEEGWMDREGMRDAELQSMELPDIFMFVDRWHNAMREELQEDAERTELVLLSEYLKEEVRLKRSIRSLATNPLMCAMLCVLNRDRKRQLPTDRIELYEACCNLLLERRDKARGVDLTDYPALNYRQKLHLLEELAYWMLKNEWSEIPIELVDEHFSQNLISMLGISSEDFSGSDVRRLFVERSGLIREPVVGDIDFTHRTFQEFLAAKATVNEMDTKVLISNAHNDQWREVIILASGLATKQMREELIKGLILRGDTEQVYRYQLHLLAVSCLETSIALGPEIQIEVQKRLSQLVPPKNVTDAKSLATAGDLAVQYLQCPPSYSYRLTFTELVASIRALSLIGSELALEQLEGYASYKEMSSRMAGELYRARLAFGREEYAQRILSKMHMARITSLDDLRYFPSITRLELVNSKARSLVPMINFTQLTALLLESCNEVSDLRPLASLAQLNLLQIGCEGVNDLSPLASLQKLTNLLLIQCRKVSDLSPLARLTQLQSLFLSNCRQVKDLSPLANLTQLKTLYLYFCDEVCDLSPLTNLTQLEKLEMPYSSQIIDLHPLVHLNQLKILNLKDCKHIINLDVLKGKKGLKIQR